MPDSSQITGLIGDASRLGAHAADVLLRRMQSGEPLTWGREPEQAEDRPLNEVGIRTVRYYLEVGESLVRLRVLDISKLKEPALRSQLDTVPLQTLTVEREGEVIGVAAAGPVVKQLVEEIRHSAPERARQWRREFLTDLGA